MSRMQNAAVIALATLFALALGVALAEEPARVLDLYGQTSTPWFLIGFAAIAAALFTPLWRRAGWWPQITSALIIPVYGVSALIAGLSFDRLVAPLTVTGQIGAKLVPSLPRALAELLTALPALAAFLLQHASLSLIVLVAAVVICERCTAGSNSAMPG
ncbi:hypothetical protein M3484_00265 [Pseudomonas sp. GX19020]|uniref:hypothetical protein n=1 Tax=Pseudomonas sp. GX19020 TaxID=2942277 RepID=UPI0020191A82|nr:hypothetical protein [Pseudomonas sp. GX19020]MCL4065011.1 hypothetical protein [Pseudomonas sp. GX19020]